MHVYFRSLVRLSYTVWLSNDVSVIDDNNTCSVVATGDVNISSVSASIIVRRNVDILNIK